MVIVGIGRGTSMQTFTLIVQNRVRPGGRRARAKEAQRADSCSAPLP